MEKRNVLLLKMFFLEHPVQEHALRTRMQKSHRTYDREMFRMQSERRRHRLLRISNERSVRQEIHISRVGTDMIKRPR